MFELHITYEQPPSAKTQNMPRICEMWKNDLFYFV